MKSPKSKVKKKKIVKNFLVKSCKQGNFENTQVIHSDLNQSQIITVFSIVQFPGRAKTVLSGDLVYLGNIEQVVI